MNLPIVLGEGASNLSTGARDFNKSSKPATPPSVTRRNHVSVEYGTSKGSAEIIIIIIIIIINIDEGSVNNSNTFRVFIFKLGSCGQALQYSDMTN